MSPSVIFLLADYGHDPTETSLPWQAYKAAGFEISFATEKGAVPACDSKMLEGITQKLLGAPAAAVQSYNTMSKTPEFQQPLSWSDPEFSLDKFNLVMLPGGHEKGVRQIIESEKVHELLRGYWKRCARGSSKAVAAICHGVLVLSETLDESGKSVLAEAKTTTLPGAFETGVYWGTRAFLGDYYKTYGHGSENCEDMVKKRLNNPSQFVGSVNPGPFIVEDEKHNYVSGRYPADAELLAEKAIAMVKAGYTA